MSIAFKAWSFNDGAAGPATKPAGTAEDDLLLAVTLAYNGDVTAAPAGWTLQAQGDWDEGLGNSFFTRLYKKVAGGSEPADYTWTFSGSNPKNVLIAAYSGVLTSGPVEAGAYGEINSTGLPDTSLVLPGVTTLGGGRQLVAIGHKAITLGTVSMVAPWTARKASGLEWVLDREQTLAGASGDQTVTMTHSMTAGAFLVALVPAPGVPGDRNYCGAIESL